MKSADRKRLEKKLDAVWSEKVRAKGYCEHCGARDKTLQAHHLYSRKHKGTRWDIDNGVCLCVGCHLYIAHKDILLFADWCRQYYGDDKLERLKIKALGVSKWTESDLIILLNELKSA